MVEILFLMVGALLVFVYIMYDRVKRLEDKLETLVTDHKDRINNLDSQLGYMSTRLSGTERDLHERINRDLESLYRELEKNTLK